MNYSTRRSHRDPIRLSYYCDSRGIPNVGIACDASCVGFKGTIANDGYFHGKVEWQCVDLATKENIFKSDVLPQATINIGEFIAIATSLKILKDRGDKESPVWSDSKLTIAWAIGRYTSSNLPMNEFTWEALDGMKWWLDWLKENNPGNPILWWNKHKFGDHPADFGRKPGVGAPKKLVTIEERAKTLVDTFSSADGSGSVLTTCPNTFCTWPKCLCVTR